MAGGKRTASSDLNHNNWNEEDDPEEAGSFAKATESILRNRVIKLAKRRNPIGSVSEPEKKGAFANFGGFNAATAPGTSSSTSSAFSFLTSEQPKTNGLGSTTYYAKIKGLNESVSNWIKNHVDSNPLINLTPIFRDYEKYLDEIEGDLSSAPEKRDDNKTAPAFNFVKSTDVLPPKPTNDNESDEDSPKLPEFTRVVEDGHIYTTRCKVFVKKGDSYGDRGVGCLYLKPVPDGDKTQLIVRGDTSIGQLLCNFILSKSIPTQRMGKKDVMLVCVPLPDNKSSSPVPVLLRVKSPEDADELLNVLEKHKK